MRALVVFESMYGNTRQVAEAIGRGLGEVGEVSVVPLSQATAERVDTADLVVVGGPTHVHSMSRPLTRKGAADDAVKEGSVLQLEPEAQGDGVREWLEALGTAHGCAAAFDTRIRANPLLTGRASKPIARRLRRTGFELVAPPESFLVSKESVLEEGEAERAVEWGRQLGRAVAPASVSGS